MEKIKDTKTFYEFGSFFWKNPAKIRPQFYQAAYIFIQPLLSYAAGELPSGEHRGDGFPCASFCIFMNPKRIMRATHKRDPRPNLLVILYY